MRFAILTFLLAATASDVALILLKSESKLTCTVYAVMRDAPVDGGVHVTTMLRGLGTSLPPDTRIAATADTVAGAPGNVGRHVTLTAPARTTL